MRDKRNLLLLAASVFVGLLVWELGLRLFTRYGRGSTAVQAEMAPEKTIDTAEAVRYVEQMPIAAGTDRKWFTEDPPKLDNRTAPAPEVLARFGDFQKLRLHPEQAENGWNRYLVEDQRCSLNPYGWFNAYPKTMTVKAFTPPTPTTPPAYRFLPGSTGASGLVTNQFGLRGHSITLAKPPKTIRIAFL